VKIFVKGLRGLTFLVLSQRLVDLFEVLRSCNKEGESHGVISRVDDLYIPGLSCTHLNYIEINRFNYQRFPGRRLLLGRNGLSQTRTPDLSSDWYRDISENIRLNGDK